MNRTLLFSLCILLFTQCGDSDTYILKEEVDEEIIGYFISFALEGELRGRSINWNFEKVSTEFVDSDSDVIGNCMTFSDGTNLINVDKTNWNASSDLKKEFLIFHELGHCVLERSHTNAATARGTCKSIMNSGENICITNYSFSTRDAYLDELFL